MAEIAGHRNLEAMDIAPPSKKTNRLKGIRRKIKNGNYELFSQQD